MFSTYERDSSPKYGNTIRKVGDYTSENYTYYPIAIVGAGESGIATGCRIKEELGFDQFRIFERQSGIGGTWWINRYPGVACDIPASFYSFSFCPNLKKTSSPPTGKEILQYLQDVCEQYKIVDKIQLHTDVKECRWLESEQVWELTLLYMVAGTGDLSEHDRLQKLRDNGRQSVYSFEEKVRARVVISAVGCLVEPKRLPEEIHGSEKFRGQIFHSARWRYDVDLADKDIIVLGAGCSATQFMPLLTENYGARSVTQIMRSPPWVIPQVRPRSLGIDFWNRWSPWLASHIPGIGRFMRYYMAVNYEKAWRVFGTSDYSENERKKKEVELLAHMKKNVPKKYHEILSPNYKIGCKRRVLDTAWLSSLDNPAIALTTLPLSSIGETDVTLGPGRMYPDPKDTMSKAPNHKVVIPADVIILANGFHATAWLHSLEVVGRGGKRLRDIFNERGGPQMYMGTAMDGFPNFFTILGPNTLTGYTSSIIASENSVNLCLKFIKPLLENDVKIIEIKKEAELNWTRDIQNALKKTVRPTGSCNSWYLHESGWNSVVYPHSQFWFTLYSIFPSWSDWDIKYTSKGLVKNIARKSLNTFALTALSWGIIKLRNNQGSICYLKSLIQAFMFNGSDFLFNVGRIIR